MNIHLNKNSFASAFAGTLISVLFLTACQYTGRSVATPSEIPIRTLASEEGSKNDLGPADLRNGDFIFQQSTSRQSQAIREATGSDWTHVGLLFEEDGTWMVFEAGASVKWTPLADFKTRGKKGVKHVIRRVRPDLLVLDARKEEELRQAAIKFKGKAYDLLFEWSDEKIYCSELTFKAYKNAFAIELGPKQVFGDLNLDGQAVQALVNERLGSNAGDLNYSEEIVTPGAQFESSQLLTIGTL